jgi:sucrose phosphorylase
MLNFYPDSLGGTLKGAIALLAKPAFREAFGSLYLLPSLFNSDLDRGYSVIDYSLNKLVAEKQDLDVLKGAGYQLKLDFILNHLSVLSPQFQDLLQNGQSSEYRDFFIDWNKFWSGCGEMTADGYIQPRPDLIRNMFFRKPGLPILMVRMPDGKKIPYWNTFYQEVRYEKLDPQDLAKALGMQYLSAEQLAGMINRQLEKGVVPEKLALGHWESLRAGVTPLVESRCRYLGQMDLNIRSPKVWEYYQNALATLAGYGASIVRLDAFAYAPKEPGARNFLNDPGTWDLLAKLQTLAEANHVTLLPEIHASYSERIYALVASKGYMTYDFFLPGLMIDALERGSGEMLAAWAQELLDKKISTVNMLGCHDGIPLLDLKGLLPEERIQALIDLIVARGGMVKNLHGQKNVYYQVNATYYSALGESDAKLVMARAIQMFMPGKPQVWYLDLFAGRNDLAAVQRAGEGGHKEINRTNLTAGQAEAALQTNVVRRQLALLRLRKSFPAFGQNAQISVKAEGHCLDFVWRSAGCTASLHADLAVMQYRIHTVDARGHESTPDC